MNFHLQVRQDSGWRIRRSVDRMSEEKDVLREAKVTKVKSVFICPDIDSIAVSLFTNSETAATTL